MRQWELAVEQAATELQDTEEELQEATTQLLSLQARRSRSQKEVLSSQQLSRCLPHSHQFKETPTPRHSSDVCSATVILHMCASSALII